MVLHHCMSKLIIVVVLLGTWCYVFKAEIVNEIDKQRRLLLHFIL